MQASRIVTVMSNKQRLELTWIGKENRPKLEPRILLEDTEKSYHAKHRVTDHDLFDNRIIFGDNLLALKALEQEFTGKIKCIYIDPPYNTGSALEHYEDGIEHSLWLTLIRERLDLLRRLLTGDGSIWVSINDLEGHYLKILMDEVFGRANFVASIIWQMIYTTKNTARHFSDMHEYILVYSKDIESFRVNLVPREAKQDDAYRNLDNDPRGPWKATPLHARNYYSLGSYDIISPVGRTIRPPSGTYWRISQSKFEELKRDNRIWWGKGGAAVPAQKRFLRDVKQGVTPSTLWLHSDVGHNAEAKNEIRALFGGEGETFLTPKPERLIKRILELGTGPGDIVLDSFAGSGTTGAVAHKMGRRWIMVELGEHCHTLIAPRLKKVVDGQDSGGITEAVEWIGGGGFRYYHLAPSLLEKDRWGNWVINKRYNAAMLAEAVCKLEGFQYAPSDAVYWQHGHSTERDFIYITTAHLSHAQLEQLSDEVGPGRTLLVLCTAFRGRGEYLNLTVKKIPKAVLSRCQWGHDDYSLRVETLPKAPPPKGQQALFGAEVS
jgi:adenine-specific DNA-methyltransferase